jgi:hypothetical protein
MTASFERFAGYCALASGIGGFLYSVAFVIVARAAGDVGTNLSWLILLAGGLLTLPVLVALYEHLREVDRSVALLGLLLGATGALGSIVHAGYQVANIVHLGSIPASDLPSQVDPRGLLTFGLTGLGVLAFAWLIGRSPRFPLGLSRLGLLAGVLLIVVYLARLIIFSPTNPLVVVGAGLTGFIVSPAFYVWLGLVFLNQGVARRS